MTKEMVLTLLEKMPNEFELDELFEKLVFIEKVEAGRKEIKEEKGIDHDEVKKIISEWRK